MSKQEPREQRINGWLDHLRRCEAAGGSVASYAKQHGIAVWKLYQWRSRLIRDGLWPARIREAEFNPPSEVVPVRFARVAVTSPAPAYVVRLQLGNGRRAEIGMAHPVPLVHLIGTLESLRSDGVPASPRLRVPIRQHRTRLRRRLGSSRRPRPEWWSPRRRRCTASCGCHGAVPRFRKQGISWSEVHRVSSKTASHRCHGHHAARV